jgi:uncharacterized protein
MAKVLDGLLELHRTDQERRDVQREAERLPAALTATEAELAGLEEKRAALLEEVKNKQVIADRSNVEIKTIEEKIDKYQVQLNITKTQKEFNTLKHEITVAQEQISELETGALTAYEEADSLGASARELDPLIADAQKRLKKAGDELKDRLADLDHEREKLDRQRTEQVKKVDGDDLKLYELVLSKHTDGALVRIDNGLCTVCNISLTPQSYNLVLIGAAPQKCRSCGRICYSEDSPGSQ